MGRFGYLGVQSQLSDEIPEWAQAQALACHWNTLDFPEYSLDTLVVRPNGQLYHISLEARLASLLSAVIGEAESVEVEETLLDYTGEVLASVVNPANIKDVEYFVLRFNHGRLEHVERVLNPWTRYGTVRRLK